MLEYLDLKNFQIHRRYRIGFERVTSLIGATNAGKSSILRALLWVCLNRWDGEANEFISWGASAARVSLGVDGHKITRAKGGKNLYKLDGQRFSAFGTKVPDKIADLLRLAKPNFQTQLENHFWFSLPAPQVARELNQIINLGSIDDALTKIAAEARRSKLAVEFSQERYKASKQERDSLDWVADADKALQAIEQTEKRSRTERNRAAELEVLLNRATKTRLTLSEARTATENGSAVVNLGTQAKRARKLAAKLETLLAGIRKAQKAASVRIPTLPSPKTAATAREQADNLGRLLSSLEQMEQTLWQAEQSRKKASRTLRNEFGKNCPICGSTLTT